MDKVLAFAKANSKWIVAGLAAAAVTAIGVIGYNAATAEYVDEVVDETPVLPEEAEEA